MYKSRVLLLTIFSENSRNAIFLDILPYCPLKSLLRTSFSIALARAKAFLTGTNNPLLSLITISLLAGMSVAINGKPIRFWDELQNQVYHSPGKELDFRVQRQSGKTTDVKITPIIEEIKDPFGDTKHVGLIGVTPLVNTVTYIKNSIIFIIIPCYWTICFSWIWAIYPYRITI